MNKPIREPCRTCANFRYCGLERRGICTDYKKKKQQGQTEIHKLLQTPKEGANDDHKKYSRNQWPRI